VQLLQDLIELLLVGRKYALCTDKKHTTDPHAT
jgi:hypothetical protein